MSLVYKMNSSGRRKAPCGIQCSEASSFSKSTVIVFLFPFQREYYGHQNTKCSRQCILEVLAKVRI